jgi:hypothetical protein
VESEATVFYVIQWISELGGGEQLEYDATDS